MISDTLSNGHDAERSDINLPLLWCACSSRQYVSFEYLLWWANALLHARDYMASRGSWFLVIFYCCWCKWSEEVVYFLWVHGYAAAASECFEKVHRAVQPIYFGLLTSFLRKHVWKDWSGSYLRVQLFPEPMYHNWSRQLLTCIQNSIRNPLQGELHFLPMLMSKARVQFKGNKKSTNFERTQLTVLWAEKPEGLGLWEQRRAARSW